METRVLDRDSGVVSLMYEGKITSLDDTVSDYDGALSYVLHREDGDWNIVQLHESSSVPAE